jgi:hypothetical protein
MIGVYLELGIWLWGFTDSYGFRIILGRLDEFQIPSIYFIYDSYPLVFT